MQDGSHFLENMYLTLMYSAVYGFSFQICNKKLHCMINYN